VIVQRTTLHMAWPCGVANPAPQETPNKAAQRRRQIITVKSRR
jgi:hypothetical protein